MTPLLERRTPRPRSRPPKKQARKGEALTLAEDRECHV